MGVGYTLIVYDAATVEAGFSDVAACRYDGIEMGLGKLRANRQGVGDWLDRYDLEMYCVMSEWLESESAVERVVEDMPLVAETGAEFFGVLPPQRNRQDDETVEQWLGEVVDAATAVGVRPLIHHHGATHIEQPDEIRHFLGAVDGLGLLWDTAHHYPYGDHYPEGDVTDGIEEFADDIEYVHLKDVDPPGNFAAVRDNLTGGDFHLDNVINYFRSFTDLGEGVLEFEDVYETLEAAGYDGHYTIEIENLTEDPLVHAK
jgi:inosose dehydratase